MNRKRAQGIIISVLVVVAGALVVFAPSFGWAMRQYFAPSRSAVGDAASLAAENEVLKAELSKLSAVADQMPKKSSDAIAAMVYSRYPMNFKNEILVNAGTEDGVREGAAVTYHGILIGTVITAFPHEALVRTVFDPGFKMPVRVGKKGNVGLLEGGAYPKVGSLAKETVVEQGDVVYAVAQGVSYGIPVGEVSGTSPSADNLFEEAPLTFAYSIDDVESVLIAR